MDARCPPGFRELWQLVAIKGHDYEEALQQRMRISWVPSKWLPASSWVLGKA